MSIIEETEQDTGAPEDATAEPGPNDVPGSDVLAENLPAAEADQTADTIEVNGLPLPPVEENQTETDVPTTAGAELPIPGPEVTVETEIEIPPTTTEEAPITTEPPKEDELPVPDGQAIKVDQSTAPADPTSTGEAATEAVSAPLPVTDAPAEPSSSADIPTETSSAVEVTVVAPSAVVPASAEETAVAIAQSAENAASAYKSRTRRRSSVSSTDSRETVNAFQPEVTPSMNRLSILYEGSQRRMCFDAEVVERIEVWRDEGRIEVIFTPPKSEEGENILLPKGYLVSSSLFE